MTTCVLYLDMNGMPVQGMPIPNSAGRKELSDLKGVVRYDPDLPPGTKLWPPGYATATIIDCAQMPPLYIPKFVPGAMLYTGITRASFGRGYDPVNFPCLQGKYGTDSYLSAPFRVQFRNADGGESGAWYANSEKELWEALDAQGIDHSAICPQFKIPASLPSPQPSTLEQIVTNMTSAISGMLSRLTALEQGIEGIWNKLEAWLIERIVAILLKGLDREVEKRGK